MAISFEKSVSSQERNYIQQVQILLVDDKGHIVRVLYLALSAAVNSWVAHPRISPFSDKKFPPLRSLCSALRQFRFLESSFSYFHVNVTHCTSFCPGERTALCSNLISLDLFIFFLFRGNLYGIFKGSSRGFPLSFHSCSPDRICQSPSTRVAFQTLPLPFLQKRGQNGRPHSDVRTMHANRTCLGPRRGHCSEGCLAPLCLSLSARAGGLG